MSTTLYIAIMAALPAGLLFTAAWSLFRRARSVAAFLQIVGAAGFLLVVLAHLCESLGLFPAMGWGEPRSTGHYLDLASMLLGVIVFPLGYWMHVRNGGNKH